MTIVTKTKGEPVTVFIDRRSGGEDGSDHRGGALDGRRVQEICLPQIRKEPRDEAADEGPGRPDAQQLLAA